MQEAQKKYKVFDLSEQHLVENSQNELSILQIGFSSNRIKLSMQTSDCLTQNDVLRDDLFQLYIEDKQLKKDFSLTEIKKEKNEPNKNQINTFYHYDNLRIFDNIYFKYSIYNKQSIKLFTVKDYHEIGNLQSKFIGKFKFQELSHNILNFICFFLLPHESMNLFLTFKSNSLNRVMQESTIWKQYAKYLELEHNDEEINRETFFQLYRNRQLGFQLEQCKSVYNEHYQCQIKKIGFRKTNIQIDFRVEGNYSLGQLQNPLGSKLSVNNRNLNLLIDQCIFKEENNNQSKQIYDGFLTYQKPSNMKIIPNMEFSFEFGQGGYSETKIFQITNDKLRKFELFQLIEKKYLKQFKIQQLSKKILFQIFSFLYPHESFNLFLTFKSVNLTSLIEESTLWQQYFKYLNLQVKNQIFSRESFNQFYKDRKLSIELNECKSVYNKNYQCEIQKINFSKKHIVIDFTVQGNNSKGPLQNPRSSMLLLFGQNIYQYLQYSDYCQIKEENLPNKQLYQGFLTFQIPENMILTKNVSFIFEYGSSGYSQVKILELTNELLKKFELYNFT
ncbi:hypothetical protein TTHERM_00613630 (macronuclear) [Tetrahymena thermophila SB210]|uniref:F-box domain-containing protein n=1 Tax=Tetrahymena thermophila (strain SB210) TaxID=312017 RepID=Q22YC2_TETTS|nr:hypothetical protein TTHERM_00613630 [Tetrahymena thermophila SB210]EAR90363.1 hypothetical protein TTHERM_00613630 [Tetrahymena thermophila SB210]|eukprot:XP_001010608.1 hypothetical protein TTHERM_00613630 [Tetrahymena thermophila SB210]